MLEVDWALCEDAVYEQSRDDEVFGHDARRAMAMESGSEFPKS